MPLMILFRSILRVNAYIVFRSRSPEALQKHFLLDLCQEMYVRSVRLAARRRTTRRRTQRHRSRARTSKRRRISSKKPSLPECRLMGQPEDHIQTITDKQKYCVYCSYVKALLNLRDPDAHQDAVPKVRATTRICNACQLHVCKGHFEVFHDRSCS